MKTVLFICIGNSCRSQMAEGFFNASPPKGWKAVSAGTNPAGSVSQDAISVMDEEGIDMINNYPKKVTPDMINNADRIISMGCGAEKCIPDSFGYDDWGVEDPMGQDIDFYRKIRDGIKAKVGDLIRDISSQ